MVNFFLLIGSLAVICSFFFCIAMITMWHEQEE